MGDATATARQRRRLARLAEAGIERTTVQVHRKCRGTLDELRPYFRSPDDADTLSELVSQLRAKTKPVNVAQVRQLSPFRYPGGKTWLVPEVRKWLQTTAKRPSVFVEPFAGGAMAGLTCAAENLADQVVLAEIDEDVAAVWETVFSGSREDVDWLCRRILAFKVNLENVLQVLEGRPRLARTRAFRTIIKNRMQRGGIMAPGAGLVKEGEAGRGLRSRWYPETLVRRLRALHSLRERIEFRFEDAFSVIEEYKDEPAACFFIDPPYTAGNKKAGKRLYTHNEVDHERLFALMASVKGAVMMSYDDDLTVRNMAEKYGFRVESVPMKNTHHAVMLELLLLKP